MEKRQAAIVLAAIFNSQGQILISKRIDKKFPAADGKWEFVGGRIEFGEEPKDAAAREALEESGLQVEVKSLLPKIYNNIWTDTEGNEVQTFLITYKCTVKGGALHTVNFDRKIAELKFINPEEIKEYETLPAIKDLVKLAAEFKEESHETA